MKPALFLIGLIVAACSLIAVNPFTEEQAVSSPRDTIPQYLTIPAATPERLTLASKHTPESAKENWTRSHGNSASSRFSALDQINRANVQSLQQAWIYRSGDGKANLQCNPVVVDGVIYGPTGGDAIVAIDAKDGRERWRFKPEGHPAQRGLLYWPGNAQLQPRLYFLSDRFLYALDTSNGVPAQSFGVAGRLAFRDSPLPAGIGVIAPVIYQNMLVALEADVVKGFRVDNGELLWSFYLNPLEGEFGSETWSRREKGVNSWGGMALDEERGITYISTGSPHPNGIGSNHLGRNLFANSVVALDARTGKRLWHFQEIRHDIWDLDIPAPPVLVTVNRAGKKVDAVAQVTKIGNTLLLDRVTGQPLFPFRLRKAPESKIPGERTWPYQPNLELPQPFARQQFTPDDVTDISPAAHQSVMRQIRNATHGWFVPFEEGRPHVYYGVHGGAEWTGAAFDPQSGLLYVTANEVPWILTLYSISGQPRQWSKLTAGQKTYNTKCAACHGVRKDGSGLAPGLLALNRIPVESVHEVIVKGRGAMPPVSVPEHEMNPLLDFLYDRDLPPTPDNPASAARRYVMSPFRRLVDPEGYPGSRPPWGTLNAIDLNTGKLVWKIPLGEFKELSRRGIPVTGTENFGGAIVTAGGLVFAAGTPDNKIRAFDSTSGKQLWEHDLPFGGYAPPATYAVNGRQYVVITATGGGKLGGPLGDAYVAFAIPK